MLCFKRIWTKKYIVSLPHQPVNIKKKQKQIDVTELLIVINNLLMTAAIGLPKPITVQENIRTICLGDPRFRSVSRWHCSLSNGNDAPRRRLHLAIEQILRLNLLSTEWTALIDSDRGSG